MAQYKFDDCGECKFRKSKRHCRNCDFGEFFEEDEIQELDFSDKEAYRRSNKNLVTIDDEPYHNPDDFIFRFENQEDDDDLEPIDDDDDLEIEDED